MLRLWNKFSARLRPPSTSAVGLGISGNRIMAVRVEPIEKGRCITHVAEEHLPFMPFRDIAPRAGDAEILAQAMQRIAVAVPQAHWTLQIALPDPAAIFQVMEFDSLPKTSQEREAIARFRMEREWPAVAQMECSFQVLDEEKGRALLLALAVQRSWMDCLREGCRAAGFVPSVTDISLNHIFNRFQDEIAGGTSDGVLISLDADSWSILFWDRALRPRFSRSRWRDANRENGADHEAIAQDVERLVRAYVLALSGRRIERVYFCSGMAENVSFATRLNARMQVHCTQLDMTEGVFVTTEISIRDISLGVLAATIPRS